MTVTQTGFKDLLILSPEVFNDSRGYFMESYNCKTLRNLGVDLTFIQDNESYSKKGVLRGLHFQKNPHAQTKLIRVLQGKILDVVVDLRVSEPTYKKSFSIILSSENKTQLLVPKGFAHGFVVLSESASVLYKCDEYYNKASEGGIRFDDPELNIDWIISKESLIVSDRDRELSNLKDVRYTFE
jgi:dTDP-4-dehydrorhamnose 3,5-epimerase